MKTRCGVNHSRRDYDSGHFDRSGILRRFTHEEAHAGSFSLGARFSQSPSDWLDTNAIPFENVFLAPNRGLISLFWGFRSKSFSLLAGFLPNAIASKTAKRDQFEKVGRAPSNSGLACRKTECGSTPSEILREGLQMVIWIVAAATSFIALGFITMEYRTHHPH